MVGWISALTGASVLGFLLTAPNSAAQFLGETECSDAIDNDGDGYIDLADPSCLGDALNVTETLGTQCDDNLDNEPDGQTDLADAGCLGDLLRDDESGEYVVNSTLDKVDGAQCRTDMASECTLRMAVMQANARTGIQGVQVPAGTFELTIPRRPGGFLDGAEAGDLDITDDLVLIGAGADHTRIGGISRLSPFSDKAFGIPYPVQVKFSGVTIQYTYNPTRGGGIGNWGTLVLTNSSISGTESVDVGGGIYNGGTLTLTNSTVSGNYAGGSGAGIYNGLGDVYAPSYGTLTLVDSTVSGNVIADPYYVLGAAGIHNYSYSTATLINSTVSGNYTVYAIYAGGILNDGTMTLTNSTVSGNHAPVGGGILNTGLLTLVNTSVSGNEAYQGDGIFNTAQGQTEAVNSIIAANGNENCMGPFVSNGHNLADDTTCFAAAGTDLVVADAMLGPLADHGGPTETHDLLSGSPAIDTADDANCPATDQRGEARPLDGDGDGMAHCDIGAIEFLPEPASWLLLAAGAGALVVLRRVGGHRASALCVRFSAAKTR